MAVPFIKNSFVSGEISPELWGRTDLEKYQSGASTMRNTFVNYRGGANSRAGTAFVGYSLQTVPGEGYREPLPAAPRLVPFQFSVNQGLVLEFGDEYMRVVSNGAFVTESAINITGVTNTNPAVVSATATGADTVTPNDAGVVISYAPGDQVTIAGGIVSVPAVIQVNTTELMAVDVSAPGTGYAAGDTVTLAGGVQTSPTVATVSATQVNGIPTIVNGGTGGTPGTATVTGTTGTGTKFQASVTITGSQSAAPNNGGVTASYAPGDTVTLAGGTLAPGGSPAVLSVTSTEVLHLTGVAAGQGYAPGDTLVLGGGSPTIAPGVTVSTTKVSGLPGIAAAGTGGTPGTATVTGTTGTGTKFQANVTISSGGVITSVNSMTLAGSYTVNPTVPSNEPVTGGGLTGAALDLTMGVSTFTFTATGIFSINPAANTFTQNSTSGTGTGATFLGLFGPAVLAFSSPGNYTVFPANPVAQAATSGSGSGVTFTVANSSTITAVNSLTVSGSYTVNPSNPAAEPVTGGGLTGAELGIVMGVGTLSVTSPGVFTSNAPGGTFSQASTSGAGTGASFQFGLFAPATMSVVNPGSYASFPANPVSQGSTTGFGLGATFDFTTGAISPYNNGDWVFIEGVGGAIQLNGRTFVIGDVSGGTFALFDVFGNPIDETEDGVFTSGGTAARIFTLTTPYAAVDLPFLKFTQSADVMSLTCWNQITLTEYPPQDLTRLADNNFIIAPPAIGATIQPPQNISASALNFAGGGQNSKGTGGGGIFIVSYTVTAVTAVTGEESLGCPEISVANNTLGESITDEFTPMNLLTWSSTPGAAFYNIYAETPTSDSLQFGATFPPPSGILGFIGQTTTTNFMDTGISPDFSKGPPQHNNPFQPGQILSSTVISGGNGYSFSVPTGEPGSINPGVLYENVANATVNSATGSGAIIIPLIGAQTRSIASMVIQSAGQNYEPDDTITINGDGSGATATLTVGPEAGTFPGVVAYFQERRVYASTQNNPDTYFFSQSGLFLNFDTHFPVVADDAITGSPWSVEVNGIQWMINMPGGLVVLTGSSAWQLTGAGGSSLNPVPITPAAQQAQPQAFNGASPTVPPIKIDYQILYVQSKGSIVREFSYQFYTNIYTGVDLTEISSQLFTDHTILEWAYAEEPYKVIWAVRDDGVMLSETYLKPENVSAWARHDTQGAFVSVASVTELPIDAVYVVVQRNIAGNMSYMIERMDNRQWQTAEQAWCVDAGLNMAMQTPQAVLSVSSPVGAGQLTGVTDLFGGLGYSSGTFAVITDMNGQGPGVGAIAAVTVSTGGGGSLSIVQFGAGIAPANVGVSLDIAATAENWLVALVASWDGNAVASGWMQIGKYFPDMAADFINAAVGVFVRQVQSGDGTGPFTPISSGDEGEMIVIYEINGIGATFIFDAVNGESDVTSSGLITVGNGAVSGTASGLQLGMAIGQQGATSAPSFDSSWTSDITQGPSNGGMDGNVTLNGAHRTISSIGTSLDANVTFTSQPNGLAFISINLIGGAAIPAGSIASVAFPEMGSRYQFPAIEFVDPAGSAGGTGASAKAILNNNATFMASEPVFTSEDVGNIIRTGGGIAEVVTFISNTQVIANILVPITDTVPNSGTATTLPMVKPQQSGSWTMATPTTVVGGLFHLIGATVTGLADGNVIPPQIVASDGTITLSEPATMITVGLGFVAQLQSVYWDGGQGAVSQGRRKRIPAATARIEISRDLMMGANEPDGSALSPPQVDVVWNNLTTVPNRRIATYNGLAVPLFTGDVRIPIPGDFDTRGQVALQQSNPLPMNILAVIPEIMDGDVEAGKAGSQPAGGGAAGSAGTGFYAGIFPGNDIT